jgi:signal transduction protein with GAF and PtsI domain
VRSASEANGEVSLCGEMAGRPLEAMALIGAGVRTLSMQPANIGPVKMMIRSLDTPRDCTIRGRPVRPHRSQPAHAAGGLCRRTRLI